MINKFQGFPDPITKILGVDNNKYLFIIYKKKLLNTNKTNQITLLAKKCGSDIASKSKNFQSQQNGWGTSVLAYQQHWFLFFVTSLFTF
jgi:hypothetical protein